MAFEVISSVSDFKNGDSSTKESAALRNTRLGTLFASSVTYSMVFDVYVFRILSRLAQFKKSIPTLLW